MAQNNSLLDQRRQESEEYKALHGKIYMGGLIKDLSRSEITRIEDLFQLYHNGEFGQRKQADLEFLVEQKAKRTQKRLTEGKPPFEETYFQRWEWDNGRYKWQEKEGDNPCDYTSEGLVWEPKELTPPASHPEKENTRI